VQFITRKSRFRGLLRRSYPMATRPSLWIMGPVTAWVFSGSASHLPVPGASRIRLPEALWKPTTVAVMPKFVTCWPSVKFVIWGSFLRPCRWGSMGCSVSVGSAGDFLHPPVDLSEAVFANPVIKINPVLEAICCCFCDLLAACKGCCKLCHLFVLLQIWCAVFPFGMCIFALIRTYIQLIRRYKTDKDLPEEL